MRTRIFLVFLVFQVFKVTSQHTVDHSGELWFSYLCRHSLTGKVAFIGDSHWVPGNFFIIRPGIEYAFPNIKSKPKLAVGYAHLWFQTEDYLQDENRLWSQLILQDVEKFGVLKHRFRFEVRFREDEEGRLPFSSIRLRYLIQMKHELKADWGLWKPYWLVSDEVLYNAGPKTSLDQNRFSVGLGMRNNHLAIQLAYLQRIKPDASDQAVNMIHTLNVTMDQTF